MTTETLMTAGAQTTDTGATAGSQSTAATTVATTAEPSAKAPDTATAATTEPGKQEGEQTPEAKAAEEAKAADAAKAKQPPEQYEDFTAPEGVKLDTDVQGEFKAVAKELGLNQESAQKVADLGVKLSQKWAQQQTEQIQAAQAEWAEATKTDKEIGGDKLAENLAVAKTAMKAFGSEALTNLLNESGLGNHPEIIRAFVKAGKAIAQDSLVSGGRQAAPPKDTASTLYPNQA